MRLAHMVIDILLRESATTEIAPVRAARRALQKITSIRFLRHSAASGARLDRPRSTSPHAHSPRRDSAIAAAPIDQLSRHATCTDPFHKPLRKPALRTLGVDPIAGVLDGARQVARGVDAHSVLGEGAWVRFAPAEGAGEGGGVDYAPRGVESVPAG